MSQPGMSRRDVLLGSLSAAAAVTVEGCFPNKEHGKETKKEALASSHVGDWELEATNVGTVIITEQKKTVFHFLKRVLQGQDWYMRYPQQDQQNIIDGYIQLMRALNPGVDIDTFANIEGKPVHFPVEVDILSRPAAEISKGNGGYSRVQELASADGFDFSSEAAWEAMYEQALSRTVEVPEHSSYYHLDREGSEDSPARLEADVLARLEEMGQSFSSHTFGGRAGWRFSLTDFLRSPAVQRTRHAKEKSPVLATTHYTGRSFDVSDGRFIDPDGKLVTWSLFDAQGNGTGPGPFADMIEKEIRPALVEAMTSHGFYPYREAGHWHAYAPKEHHADLRALETK